MEIASLSCPSLMDDLSHLYGSFQFQNADDDGLDAPVKKRPRIKNTYQNEEAYGTGKPSLNQLLLGSMFLLDEDEEGKWSIPNNLDFHKTLSAAAAAAPPPPMHQQQLQQGFLESSQSQIPNSADQSSPSGSSKRPRRSLSDETNSTTDAGGSHQRRLWVKDRSKAWWDRCNSPEFPEEEFKGAFRMSKATFDTICEQLESAVTKKDTMLRAAIPVRQRVAVCIWRLATGEPLRLVSKRFGLGISTCHKLILEVCSAIRTVLMPKFLQWPVDHPRLASIKHDFLSLSRIPDICGAMYTTHVPIIAPKISVGAYFNKRHTERNQKTSYSMTVQGVVDHRGVFTDVCIGWPGSMSDEQVLEKSAVYKRASAGELTGAWIAGGRGYPLTDWLLVPYAQPNLTWTQHAFNERIGEAVDVAKEAFARLKGRWACLQKRTEVKLQDLPVVLGACCVLHNICEIMGEGLEADQRFQIFDDEMVAENNIRSNTAAQARENIAHNLLHHGLAGTEFL